MIESSRWLTQASCVGCDFSVNIVISRPGLTLREYLKKRFWRSVWLPTPLEDVPRRFLDYGNMCDGCPHLSVKLLKVATSSSPVRSAEAQSCLNRYVRAGAAFTGSWGQVDMATNGHDVAIPR